VQQEIDERREFLSQMEAVGQGEKHRPLIETQISQVQTKMIYQDLFIIVSICLITR
jgi:hypothetical protein